MPRKQNQVKCLGQILSLIIRHDCDEQFSHADVEAFGAPGECHDLVRKNEHKRWRHTRRRVVALAGRPWRVVLKELRKQGIELGGPKYERMVDRVYARHYPF